MSGLCGDPIYQLNVVLWMLQPVDPSVGDQYGTARIASILHQAGYSLEVIEGSLTHSAHVQTKLYQTYEISAPCAPEVIARPRGTSNDPWLVIECKRSAISRNLSKTDHGRAQATNMLVTAADMSSFGDNRHATPEAVVMYITRGEQTQRMHDALSVLVSRIADDGLATAPVAIAGIAMDESAALTIHMSHSLGQVPANIATTFDRRILGQGQTNGDPPQILYLIPYQSGVSQEPDEEAICRQILYEVARNSAVSSIAHSDHLRNRARR